MKFHYKKYSPEILRPVIPVVIKYKNKEVAYEALVDSGSDVNIFPAQLAEILGIDIKSGEKKEVWGITGVGEDYYIHSVELIVGGWSYDVKVGFLKWDFCPISLIWVMVFWGRKDFLMFL